jgi:hypothetical protein
MNTKGRASRTWDFEPPGVETDLLYLACLTTLVVGGSSPLALDSLIRSNGKAFKWLNEG